MNKINLKKNVLGFDGKAAKDEKGEALQLSNQAAAALSGSSQKSVEDVGKVYDWISSLNKNGMLEVDNTDKEKVKKIIAESPLLTVWVKGQILKEIDNSKK
ncbi:hypothetical protein [Ekhidna sp.]|jgi:hypothetical protein|uniref:hypothetical protein n=1 Tax=Ekhidna sp. TaxID=2608089 RepID=UPI0032EB72D5